MDIPDWLLRWLTTWVANKFLDWGIARMRDRHREKLADWYYIASYQLTKLFKPPLKTTAILMAEVVRDAEAFG